MFSAFAPFSLLPPDRQHLLERLPRQPLLRRLTGCTVWQGLVSWLTEPLPLQAPRVENRIDGVRRELLATLAGRDCCDSQALRLQIEAACSLRALWHARVDVCRLLRSCDGQVDAQALASRLDRHFPSVLSSRTADPRGSPDSTVRSGLAAAESPSASSTSPGA